MLLLMEEKLFLYLATKLWRFALSKSGHNWANASDSDNPTVARIFSWLGRDILFAENAAFIPVKMCSWLSIRVPSTSNNINVNGLVIDLSQKDQVPHPADPIAFDPMYVACAQVGEQ